MYSDPYNTYQKRQISLQFLDFAAEELPRSGFDAVCFPGPQALEVYEIHKAFPKIDICGVERDYYTHMKLREMASSKPWFFMLDHGASTQAIARAIYARFALSHLDYNGWVSEDSIKAARRIALNIMYGDVWRAVLRITHSLVARNGAQPQPPQIEGPLFEQAWLHTTNRYTAIKDIPHPLRYIIDLYPKLKSFGYSLELKDHILYRGSRNLPFSTFWFIIERKPTISTTPIVKVMNESELQKLTPRQFVE